MPTRRRRRAFATRDRTLAADGWQRTERVSLKEDQKERKNNNNYEAPSRGSPPGYESEANFSGPLAYSRCHRGTTSAFGFGGGGGGFEGAAVGTPPSRRLRKTVASRPR